MGVSGADIIELLNQKMLAAGVPPEALESGEETWTALLKCEIRRNSRIIVSLQEGCINSVMSDRAADVVLINYDNCIVDVDDSYVSDFPAEVMDNRSLDEEVARAMALAAEAAKAQ